MEGYNFLFDVFSFDSNFLKSLSQVQRKNAITTFNSDPKVTIFLMSLKAGGVGLNLTAGSQVFILDPVKKKKTILINKI